MREAAMRHARLALVRCEHALPLAQVLALVRDAAAFATTSAPAN